MSWNCAAFGAAVGGGAEVVAAVGAMTLLDETPAQSTTDEE